MTSDDNTPVLSGAIGEYREFDPPAALERHFLCVWSNTLRPDAGSLSAVVPDGCVDITWIDGDLVVAGPDVAVALSTLTPGSTVIGTRFRPGAASRWLGLPMSEIVGGRMGLSQFWGGAGARNRPENWRCVLHGGAMRAMQAALSRRAPDVEPPPPDVGFAFNALKTESAGPGMAVILDRLDVSPRTLRRRCQEPFGYGPKTLDRILRFQRFLNLARQSADPRLCRSCVRGGLFGPGASHARGAAPVGLLARDGSATARRLNWPFRSIRPRQLRLVCPSLKGGRYYHLQIPHHHRVHRPGLARSL